MIYIVTLDGEDVVLSTVSHHCYAFTHQEGLNLSTIVEKIVHTSHSTIFSPKNHKYSTLGWIAGHLRVLRWIRSTTVLHS